MRDAPNRRIRLLAMDVDGTLLDSRGELRPRTREAVARAAREGIRPVLCTGRRYRRARPIAEQLGIDAPIVCNSGAMVKDHDGRRTLWRADFDPSLLSEILALFEEHDEYVVAFLDGGTDGHDFIASRETSGRALFDEYVALNRSHARFDSGGALAHGPHFHLCAIGDRPRMLAFEKRLLHPLAGRVRTFVQKSPAYSGTMCEVLRHDASKWSAVLHVAEMWGIDPSEICAVGDDMNDLPMIAEAGLGVAMAHAPDVVKAAAHVLAPGNDEDGLAHVIENLLLAS